MNWRPRSLTRLISFATVSLSLLLGGGCATAPSETAAFGNKAAPKSSAKERLEQQEIAKWMENLAFIEWQVSRMAAGCHEAATTSESSRARREASRLNASFASSSYALSTRRSVIVQVLSLAAMAELYHQVWIEEGRATAEFGEQSKPVEAAILEIRERLREHAGKHLSSDELRSVEKIVDAWQKDHPTVNDVAFIRFDAFAENATRETGETRDLGGLFGTITGEARNLEFLGERLLLAMNRMPRLAEWHAEAFAASFLDDPEIGDTIAAFKQLGELQHLVIERLKFVQSVDQRFATLPSDLAAAIAGQPELKDALAQVPNSIQRVQALEQSVRGLETSITSLDTRLTQLGTSLRPDTLRQLTDYAGELAWIRIRSTLLLGAACGAVLLLLHALLRRWHNPPQPRL